MIGLTSVFAQEGSDWYVYGTIKDHFTRKKMGSVKVTVMQDGKVLDSQSSSTSGKYEFFLPLDHKYELIFSQEGIVSKKLEVDTRNIPEEDRRGGFSSNLDMSLFEEIEGIDFAILDQPIGKGAYRPERGSIEFDMGYTAQIQAELSKLMKQVEDKQKEEEKEDDQEAKEAARLEEEFQRLMADGKNEMTKKDFGRAVGHFEGAVAIKPDDAEARSSLDEAKQALADSEAAAAAEENYNKAIDEGDNAFDSKNWQEAIDAYTRASGIKANEKYPKDQIARAQKSLEDESERLADEAEVARLIEEGDAAVAKEEYSDGIDKFKAALKIMAGNKEATDKLSEAQRLLADYEANKEKRDRYDALITEADGAFDGKEYETAIDKYEAALAVMPKEQHPEDRIKEATDLLAALRADAAAAAEKAEQQAAFDALMASGEQKLGSAEFDEAIEDFEGALDIFSDDSKAQAKLDEARQAKADAQAAMEVDEQYNALIADADKAFDDEKYEEAATAYSEAIKVKDEQYPKDRLEEARRILETKVAAEEADRLAREEQEAAEAEAAELQRQFDALVEKGDDNVGKEAYESAITDYESALEIFSDDNKVLKKIDDARESLKEKQANMEEAELRAQYDEYMKDGDDALNAEEFDTAISKYEGALGVFEGDKKAMDRLQEAKDGKARKEEELADEERRRAEEETRAMAAADEAAREQQYDDYMSQGDQAFRSETFQPAIDNYEAALALFPDDKKAKSKLDRAIEALEAEAQRLAEEEARSAEEEARQAELDAERAAAEAARREREDAQALEDQYQNFIAMGDDSFSEREYRVARDNYEEALSIKSDEVYPQSQLEKIERLIEEQEEEERERAERLAAARKVQEDKDFRRGNDLASSAEDEIDARMAEERRRALQEKWDAMASDKESWTEKQVQLREKSSDRRDESEADLERYREQQQDRRERGVDDLADRSRNMEGYKEGLAAQDVRITEKQVDRTEESKKELDDLADRMSDFSKEHYSDEGTYQEHIAQMEEIKETRKEMDERGLESVEQSQEQMTEQKKEVQETFGQYSKEGRERIEEATEEIERQKKAISDHHTDTSKENLIRNSESMERDKERNADLLTSLADRAKDEREIRREELFAQKTYAGGKSPADFEKSELAEEYPAGVTEETFTEGSKEIIRRIVVVGNKATDYRKVVSRTGTYYFKNGESITEHLWKLESDKVLE